MYAMVAIENSLLEMRRRVCNLMSVVPLAILNGSYLDAD
jgi:hypothetical protein